GLGWDATNKKPVTTLANKIQDLQNKLNETTTHANQTQTALNDANAKLKENTEALEKAKNDYADKLKGLENSFSKKQEGYLAEIDRLGHELEAKGQAAAETKTTSDQDVGKIKKENDKLVKQMAQMQIKIQNLEKQIPKTDRPKLDEPKGKVESLDKRGQVAFI